MRLEKDDLSDFRISLSNTICKLTDEYVRRLVVRVRGGVIETQINEVTRLITNKGSHRNIVCKYSYEEAWKLL